MAVQEIYYVSSLDDSRFDSIILVANGFEGLKENFGQLLEPLKKIHDIDESIKKDGACVPVQLPARRLIYSPTGPLNRDIDDVRRFFDAAEAGIKRAIKTGSASPLLVTVPSTFENSKLVSLLGALHALYVPLEIREDPNKKSKKIEQLGFFCTKETQRAVELARMVESGRIVARDIGGSDPERMAPPRVEEYVRAAFKGSKISVEVISDDNQLCKEYPLFSAVNRCAKHVERHQGRIIYLTYEGQGPIEQTLFLVGKGVTYDTGGADIKAGGVMAGMHRDKCGAAGVAGFMKTLEKISPANLKVVAGLAMVRNSVGSECYVADEIIISRAGVRVRVNNTDAEGRMAMGDVLCRFKELAANEINPSLMTIATLTGHAVLAMGEGYSAIMDNGPAKMAKTSYKIQDAGELIADPFEISTIRREDYTFHEGKSEYEDICQSNNAPSTRTPRGHQSPAAFLIMASGLDKHGKDSKEPLKYSHLDIAGSSGPYPGVPTGAPLMALARAFIPNAFEDPEFK